MKKVVFHWTRCYLFNGFLPATVAHSYPSLASDLDPERSVQLQKFLGGTKEDVLLFNAKTA